jgi:excisionase family DNA binding protein
MAERHDWLTVGEVARMLHVTEKTVSRYANEGKLPYRRTLGGSGGVGHRRFPRAEIEAIAQNLGFRPAPGEPS